MANPHPGCMDGGARPLDGAGESQHRQKAFPVEEHTLPALPLTQKHDAWSIHQTEGRANGGESQEAGSHKGISQIGSYF